MKLIGFPCGAFPGKPGLREMDVFLMAKRISTFYLISLVLFLSSWMPSAQAQETVRRGASLEPISQNGTYATPAIRWPMLEKSGVAAKLTHLIYAFGNVTPGASPVCAIADPKAAWQDTSILAVNGKPFSGSIHGNFAGILELKALHPRLKTLISLGGQAGDVSGFTAAAASPAATARIGRLLHPPFHPGTYCSRRGGSGTFRWFQC